MPRDDVDLMVALGVPDGAPKGKAKGKGKTGGYLDGKPQELVSYLMDAVDDSASQEQRAEALCRAIEMSGGGSTVEDSGEGSDDY